MIDRMLHCRCTVFVGMLVLVAPLMAAGQNAPNVRIVSPIGTPQTATTDFPFNIANAQDGSPLGLRGYTANAGTYYYESATVENTSDRRVSAITFGVIVNDREDRQPRLLLRSVAVPVSLLPGQTESVMVNLFPADRLDAFLHMFKKPQAMLGVLRVSWVDGTSWEANLSLDADDFANTGKVAEVSQQQLQARTPSGAPDALCYDDDRAAYSRGALVRVKEQPDRFARCVNGAWVPHSGDGR